MNELRDTGQPWSEVIGSLPGYGWNRGGRDLRWCPDGNEHEMAPPTPIGDRVCERCGYALITKDGRTVMAQPSVYAYIRGPRRCRKCGQIFEPPKPTHHYCPDCYEFVPPPTGRQSGYILVLARLLGIEPPQCATSDDATRTVDELLLLIEADPNVVQCRATGCDRLVNRPREGTLCGRHRRAKEQWTS